MPVKLLFSPFNMRKVVSVCSSPHLSLKVYFKKFGTSRGQKKVPEHILQQNNLAYKNYFFSLSQNPRKVVSVRSPHLVEHLVLPDCGPDVPHEDLEAGPEGGQGVEEVPGDVGQPISRLID